VFEQVGYAMRYSLTLSGRSREIAILLQAFHLDSPFELYAHRQAGRAAGLADAEIEGLATRTEPDFQDDEERAVFAATAAILDGGTLDDAAYTAAVTTLGERTLFELVALLSYYGMVATQLAVFEVQPPPRA
jgi:4-carboxymuconolactone decarboxylase